MHQLYLNAENISLSVLIIFVLALSLGYIFRNQANKHLSVTDKQSVEVLAKVWLPRYAILVLLGLLFMGFIPGIVFGATPLFKVLGFTKGMFATSSLIGVILLLGFTIFSSLQMFELKKLDISPNYTKIYIRTLYLQLIGVSILGIWLLCVLLYLSAIVVTAK